MSLKYILGKRKIVKCLAILENRKVVLLNVTICKGYICIEL